MMFLEGMLWRMNWAGVDEWPWQGFRQLQQHRLMLYDVLR